MLRRSSRHAQSKASSTWVYSDLGDYERELDEYKKSWARKNKVKLADFNYGMLPSDILAPYACKDADATFQLYGKFKPLVDKSERVHSSV